MKRLLILGGIKTEINLVIQAKKMGIYTIVADKDPASPAKQFSDDSVLMDVTDVAAIVDYCKHNRIDGIVSGYVDILLEPWFKSCELLGLPCYLTPEMIKMSTDKIFFKECCELYNLPVPKTYVCGSSLGPEHLKAIKYPAFVKPLDASGSRGCGICRNAKETQERFSEALSFSKSHNAVVEDYIDGVEFLLDYVGVDGEFTLLEMFDRYMADDRDSARNYSNVSMAPSFGIERFKIDLDAKIKKMFSSMHFKNGLIFLQGHICKDRIILYEMGCRLGGSFLDLEQDALGFNSAELIINFAIYGSMINGLPPISEKSAFFSKKYAVANYLLKSNGDTVCQIEGLDMLSKDSGYLSHVLLREVGFKCVKDTLVDKPIISVFFRGDDVSSIQESLVYYNQSINVYGEKGESILTHKFDPKHLVDTIQ